MKKIATLLAVFATVIFVAPVKAQSFTVLPSAGLSLDQEGAHSMQDPVVGVSTLVGVAKDVLSLGIEMNGGQRYRYPFKVTEMIMNDDSTWTEVEKTIYKKINAPAFLFLMHLGVPSSGGAFAGTGIGLGGGMAFPAIDYGVVRTMKVFTQVCYSTDVGKYKVGGFLQGSYSFLYTSRTTFSAAVSLGVVFSIPNVF